MRTLLRQQHRSWLWLWAAWAMSGCAATQLAPQAAVVPDAGIVSSELLAPPMLLRQRLRGTYREQRFDLDCVLQVSQGRLTIVGLTPFGSRAFVLTQSGLEHSFVKTVPRELPFDPLRILEDVHRVFFRGLPRGPGARVTAVQGGDRVEEHWSEGVLRERTFERLDQNPPGVIRVTYGGPNAPLVPERVLVDNGWYGYTLQIDNVLQQSLSEGSP